MLLIRLHRFELLFTNCFTHLTGLFVFIFKSIKEIRHTNQKGLYAYRIRITLNQIAACYLIIKY